MNDTHVRFCISAIDDWSKESARFEGKLIGTAADIAAAAAVVQLKADIRCWNDTNVAGSNEVGL